MTSTNTYAIAGTKNDAKTGEIISVFDVGMPGPYTLAQAQRLLKCRRPTWRPVFGRAPARYTLGSMIVNFPLDLSTNTK